MMPPLRSDNPTSKIHPYPPLDPFDTLPDPILLLILNYITHIKSLGRCSLLSKRFHSLIPQVQNVVVPVDSVISHHHPSITKTSRTPFSSSSSSSYFFLFKPFQAIRHFFTHKRSSVTHHSPSQVLKNFNEIRVLKIELPSGELCVEDNVLLKWKAGFGSTLDYCVMLGATSVLDHKKFQTLDDRDNGYDGIEDNDNNNNGNIPESFYTDGGLKLRVVWIISSLITASARHYLLQPIVREHKTLESLILSDGDGQGELCMDKEQLEELRVKPLAACSGSKRTLVPNLSMRLWYAPFLELMDGRVLKGATLVAIRPSEQVGQKEGSDGSWVSNAFEEPYGTAARMLVRRRTYCLEMNSF